MWHSNLSGIPIWVTFKFEWLSNISNIQILVTFQFERHHNHRDIPIWETFQFEWHSNFGDIPILVTFQFKWHFILRTLYLEWHSILCDIPFWVKFPFIMWNSRSLCGAEYVAERKSSHCWTSWLALDKENHWWSRPAVAPDRWMQWALHNLLICCSQWPLDGAAQNDLGIESSQAVTHPTICGAKPCLTIIITCQALYPRSYSFNLWKSKLPVSKY